MRALLAVMSSAVVVLCKARLVSVTLILLSTLLAITGCAAKGPLFTEPESPPEGYARVVIYRETGISGAAWAHNYYIDRTLVAELRVGGYTTLVVKPGAHLFQYGVFSDIDSGFLLFSATLRPDKSIISKRGNNLIPTCQ